MKTNLKGILTLFTVFIMQISFAQEKSISGKVIDEMGLPIPGVTVFIKGTTNGTQTDFDGNYSLRANQGDIISYSYVGYKTQEAIVTSEVTVINITLSEDVSMEMYFDNFLKGL